jgi:hypothetical protein
MDAELSLGDKISDKVFSVKVAAAVGASSAATYQKRILILIIIANILTLSSLSLSLIHV